MTKSTSTYKKWTKPTKEDLNAVLTLISVKHNLEVFEPEKVKHYGSEIVVFLAKSFGCSLDTAKNYARYPEKMKLPVWIFLNVLAGNDISEFVGNHGNYNKQFYREVLGAAAFNNADDFKINMSAYDMLFQVIFKGNQLTTSFCGKEMLALSRQTKKEFSDSLSINYTVFCRNLFSGNFRYVHAKIYLLTLGFSVEEIGIF